MRAKVLLSLVGALIAAVALVSASGAATTKAQKVTKINVSTRGAVVHYLRSIHVNPKGAVIQRGALNYAGARCPGGRWTCASTKHTVVQIAKRGGQNRFVCRSSKCVVVQISGTSHGIYVSGRQLASTAAPAPNKGGSSGVCLKNGSGSPAGTGQICTINQSGSGPNTAVVWENSQKMAGLNTSLTYTATITQTATGGGLTQGNKACVTQNINLDGSTTGLKGKAVTAALEAHQSVNITQDASGSAPNTAANAAVLSGTTAICDTSNTLAQNQTLTSTVNGTAGITQRENAGNIACPDGKSPVNYFNMCLDVEQNQSLGFVNNSSVMGANSAEFVQTNSLTAIANTPNGPVTQTQGSPNGGLVGTLNQYSKGISTASATQRETQCEDAATGGLVNCRTGAGDADFNGTYTLTQTQYGPAGVGNLKKFQRHGHSRHLYKTLKGLGASTQTGGNTADQFSISQTSTQDNDGGPGSTQQNTVKGDCATDGFCTAGQTTTLNNTATQDGYTSPTITNLTIICPTSGPCVPTPPPVPVLTVTPADPSEDTNPTFEWSEAATAGVSFDCSIDSGDPVSCDSGDAFPVGLGPHTFEVTASDNFGNTSDPASFSWTVVPYLTFEWTADGAAAGWTGGVPGSSITLKVGSVSATTFGQFTLHNFEGIAIGDLAEPTFTTDAYSGGVPREEIDFNNGDYVFGYPSQAGFDPDSWQLVCDGGCVGDDGFMSWGGVQTVEGNLDATVAAALVEADGGVPSGSTYVISAFTFDDYNLSSFTNHWHNG
jgi:hypothetical protein